MDQEGRSYRPLKKSVEHKEIGDTNPIEEDNVTLQGGNTVLRKMTSKRELLVEFLGQQLENRNC